MKTPYFLISESELKENISVFKKALSDIWPNSSLAYSVKTNSLPWLLKYLKKENVLAEVVSDEEYHLVKLCGFQDKEIVFNGPIKGEEILKTALGGKAYVNVDSQKDLAYIKENRPQNAFIGIRVNVPPECFKKSDIGYQEDGFRFGFSEKNGAFADALEIIKKHSCNAKLGLHLHCNSVTRSLDVYRAIAKYAAHIIKKYDLRLSFIDIGGGFFGGVEGKPTPKQYISCIKEELDTVVNVNETKLIAEPGSAIIGSVVDLHTTVLDAKDTDYARIITTDGSRVHIDPLWTRSKYMYSIEQKEEQNSRERQIVCGYTCMDHDRLMIIENQPELQVGDEIIYHRVGAYSMTFGGMFIRYYPNVFVESKDGIERARTSISTEEYVKVHS